jgi:hypothetical protein
MYHEEIGWENLFEIHLDQGKEKWWAFVNMVMNLQVP